jgi:hypothetical protein
VSGRGALIALVVLVVAIVAAARVAGDDGTRCRYRIGAGGTTAPVELPCGLDRASVRTYVSQHPELVAPRIPVLGPN